MLVYKSSNEIIGDKKALNVRRIFFWLNGRKIIYNEFNNTKYFNLKCILILLYNVCNAISQTIIMADDGSLDGGQARHNGISIKTQCSGECEVCRK